LGLNIFVIKDIAPDIPLNEIMWGIVPFIILMVLAIVIICLFPSIAIGLPNWVMGAM
jgi:TRAP-type C4-dicarboxylate transport system permease large subunit